MPPTKMEQFHLEIPPLLSTHKKGPAEAGAGGAYKTRPFHALGYDTFEECCEAEVETSKSRVDRLIGAATVCEILTPLGGKIPARERHARPLTILRNGEDKLDKNAIIEVWNDVLLTSGENKIQTSDVNDAVERYEARKSKNWTTLTEWNDLSEEDQEKLLHTTSQTKFNSQDNDNIEWAQWSWNPVTGCKHDCPYCYARDIANRFYPQKFEPSIVPSRLNAPSTSALPPKADFLVAVTDFRL